MSICWFASTTRVLISLILAVTVCAADTVTEDIRNAELVRSNVRIARELAEKAWQSLEAGKIVRSYLLYTEAAKRDPNTALYREERNALSRSAKQLIKDKVETADIQPDIAEAERNANVSMPAAPPTKLAFSERVAPLPAAVLPSAPPLVEAAAFTAPTSIAVTLPPAPTPEAAKPASVQPSAPQTSPDQSQTTQTVQPEKSDPWHFSYATQILAYGTYDAFRSDSPFNPDNQLAQFPQKDFHVALRPDLKLGNSILSFSAKPRIDYEHSLSVSSHNSDYYLQEWSVRLQASPWLTLSYGREVPMWGPSMSVPASNPFFRDNGRNTPLLEIGARDFGRIVWQPNSNFSVTYIANTALRRGTPDFLPFVPTGGVKVDYNGKSFLLSGIYNNRISSPFGHRKFIGGYGQVTVGQSLRVYVEGSAQEGNPGYYPVDSSNFVGYAQTKLDNSLAPRTIVGGLAYTDSKAGTWTGEYIYNPVGYSSTVATSFYQTAQSLAGSYLMGGPEAGVAAQQLALTSNPGTGPLRRNYAFGQYQRNGLAGRFDVVLRYTLNAEDRSGQGVAYLTWNAADHFQVIAVFAGLNGSVDTEYSRYLHYQAQLGFRIFLH